MSIKFFSPNDPYYEFSNYYGSNFVIDGVEYLHVEVYYQSQKFYIPNDPLAMEYYNLIIRCDSPQKAKDMANMRINPRGLNWYINKSYPNYGKCSEAIRKYSSIKPRNDWDQVKIEVMRKGLEAKFTQSQHLKSLLLSTNNTELMENSPYDNFWGIGSNGTGSNILGKLLMELRSKLQ